jgi:hypothetical protein
MAGQALGAATWIGTSWAEDETFLAEKVYGGDCRHERVRIDYSNRFSDRL